MYHQRKHENHNNLWDETKANFQFRANNLLHYDVFWSSGHGLIGDIHAFTLQIVYFLYLQIQY